MAKMNNSGFNLFGYTISRGKKAEERDDRLTQETLEDKTQDGSNISTMGGIGHVVWGSRQLSEQYSSDAELIKKYRDMSFAPEIDFAVSEIVNEAISVVDRPVTLELDAEGLKDAAGIQDDLIDTIHDEFRNILELMEFDTKGHDLFARWYIDSRIFVQKVIDPDATKKGIRRLAWIDPLNIKFVRETVREKDAETNRMKIIDMKEYFIYNEDGVDFSNMMARGPGSTVISKDTIAYVTSGVYDHQTRTIKSHLHKAIKPLNQLSMIEDAVVVYRITRAPERRVFYIDVGNLPRTKAEQYLRSVMAKFRNKMVYNQETGEVEETKRHMSMLEDYWLPRREGGKSTEVQTLPGGQSLGDIEDIEYFKKKLFRSLNIPITRMDPDRSFSLGRSGEITREEIKFHKFIRRLQARFSDLFYDILKTQLIAKGILDAKDWRKFRKYMRVEFAMDSAFQELREAEIWEARMRQLREFKEGAGSYFSHQWIRENILKQSHEEQTEIDSQIKEEKNMDQYKEDESGGGRF